MTREQARNVLFLYRPGVDDEQDPEVASALALLRNDAELKTWFEQQCAFDAAMRRALAESPAPVGLKTRILAQSPARDAAAGPWGAAWRWAVGVCVVLILVVGTYALRARKSSMASYGQAMLSFVAQPYALDVESEDLKDVLQQMAKQGFPHAFKIPLALLQYPVEGGCLRDWNGQKVSLVCFGSEEHHAPDIWLFVIPRAALPSASADSTPRLRPWNDLSTASWADAEYFYLAATEASAETLAGLL